MLILPARVAWPISSSPLARYSHVDHVEILSRNIYGSPTTSQISLPARATFPTVKHYG